MANFDILEDLSDVIMIFSEGIASTSITGMFLLRWKYPHLIPQFQFKVSLICKFRIQAFFNQP